MAGVLQHLRSSTLDKRPNPASMVDGQVAINYASGSPGMFFKDSNGDLVKVGPVHVGATAPNVSPASGGTAGNSKGEQWLDTSGGTYVFKIWDGSAWRSEAGEFVNAAGDTMTGSLTMGVSANIIFEGSVDDGFETTLTVANPTADRTITLPNVTGTVVTTGDSGSITSTMIADGTIVNADVNASAAIAGTKVSPNFGSQTVQTTGIFSAAGGSAAAPSIAFTGDTNTGIYSPGADQVAISTNGTGRLFVDSSGRVGIGESSPSRALHISASDCRIRLTDTDAATTSVELQNSSGTGILSTNGATSLLFTTDNSERLRITSAGLVGIGTTTPSAPIEIVGKSTDGTTAIFRPSFNVASDIARIELRGVNSAGSASQQVFFDAYQPAGGGGSDAALGIRVRKNADSFQDPNTVMTVLGTGRVGIGDNGPDSTLTVKAATGVTPFKVSGPSSEFAKIDSSGRLLVAAPSALSNVSIAGTLGAPTYQIQGATGAAASASITRTTAGSAFFTLNAGSSGNNVASGTGLGLIQFNGFDGTNYINGASIGANVDNTPGTNDMPGRLVFSTTADGASSPTERMRIDSTGFVSLGGDTNTGFSNPSADNLAITTGGSERARIDSSGRLLVGTSSALAAGNWTDARLQIRGNSSGDNQVGKIALYRGITTANTTNDTGLAQLQFGNGDGGVGALIQASADLSWTASPASYPGRLVFSTTADGASSPTERMRISNNGDVYVGTNASPSAAPRSYFVVAGDNGQGPQVIVQDGRAGTTPGYALIQFFRQTASIGSITNNGTSVAYNTTSDYRLKENVTPVTDGITRLQQLKPSRFNFIADPTKTVDGFIAHEVQAVVPEAITGEKDAVDDEGNDQYQGIDQSKLVPLLTAALQEAVAKIESLEARLTAAGL